MTSKGHSFKDVELVQIHMSKLVFSQKPMTKTLGYRENLGPKHCVLDCTLVAPLDPVAPGCDLVTTVPDEIGH